MHVIILLLAALIALIAFMAISSYNDTNAKGGYTVSKDRVEIPIAKGPASAYFVILAVMAVFVFMDRNHIVLFVPVLIVITLVFFKPFNKKSGLIIDNDGIINSTSLFMPAKRMLWDDIYEIKLIEKRTFLPEYGEQPYTYRIKIIPYDSSKYWTEKLPGVWSETLTIHYENLKYDRDELLNLLQERLERHKFNH